MEFNQKLQGYIVETGTRTDKSLVILTSFLRSHEGLGFGKWLICTLSHEGMDEFRPNIHSYIVVTLTLFLRSHKVRQGLICSTDILLGRRLI